MSKIAPERIDALDEGFEFFFGVLLHRDKGLMQKWRRGWRSSPPSRTSLLQETANLASDCSPAGPEDAPQNDRQPYKGLARDVSAEGPERVEKRPKCSGRHRRRIQHRPGPLEADPTRSDEPVPPSTPQSSDDPRDNGRLPAQAPVQNGGQKGSTEKN